MTSVAILGRGHLGAIALNACLGAGYEVRRVVTNLVEPTWDLTPAGCVLSEHVRRFFPQILVDRSGHWRQLVGLDVDLILSVMYDRIIGADLIDGPARVLNLHLGKLPEYRGMRPINWALKNGESVAGVTLHEVDTGIDTGPIVAQATFSIWPDRDEVRDVYRRAVHAGEGLLREVIPIVDQVKAVPQDESRAGYYNTAAMAELGERANWTRAES